MIGRKVLLVALVAVSGSSAATPKFGSRFKRSAAVDVPSTRGGASAAAAAVDPKVKSISKEAAVAAGVILAFNSGFINGACLSGAISSTKQAVAAVTGAYTTGALALARGDNTFFMTQLKAILSYAGGSAIAGFMNPYPTPYVIPKSVGFTFILGSLLLLAGSKASGLNLFFLACMANGLQNSVTSVLTGNMIRTAHYSGMTSDMGTFIGQILHGNKTNTYRLKVCLALAVAFFAGGHTSFTVVKDLGANVLLTGAALYAAIGLYLTLMV